MVRATARKMTRASEGREAGAEIVPPFCLLSPASSFSSLLSSARVSPEGGIGFRFSISTPEFLLIAQHVRKKEKDTKLIEVAVALGHETERRICGALTAGSKTEARPEVREALNYKMEAAGPLPKD